MRCIGVSITLAATHALQNLDFIFSSSIRKAQNECINHKTILNLHVKTETDI